MEITYPRGRLTTTVLQLIATCTLYLHDLLAPAVHAESLTKLATN